MSETTDADAAYDAWIGEVALSGYPLTDGDFLTAARGAFDAAAPLIVADELRRIADRLDEKPHYGADEYERAHNDGVRSTVRRLRARADELDSPASGGPR